MDNGNYSYCGIRGHTMSEYQNLQYEQQIHKHEYHEDQIKNYLLDTRT
jgi:hypothetical protein